MRIAGISNQFSMWSLVKSVVMQYAILVESPRCHRFIMFDGDKRVIAINCSPGTRPEEGR
jgi:hypothetical protein